MGFKPKLRRGYEVRRCGGLGISFDYLGDLNVRKNLDTWVFSLLASIRKAATVAEIETMSSGSAAQHLSQ